MSCNRVCSVQSQTIDRPEIISCELNTFLIIVLIAVLEKDGGLIGCSYSGVSDEKLLTVLGKNNPSSIPIIISPMGSFYFSYWDKSDVCIWQTNGMMLIRAIIDGLGERVGWPCYNLFHCLSHTLVGHGTKSSLNFSYWSHGPLY